MCSGTEKVAVYLKFLIYYRLLISADITILPCLDVLNFSNFFDRCRIDQAKYIQDHLLLFFANAKLKSNLTAMLLLGWTCTYHARDSNRSDGYLLRMRVGFWVMGTSCPP